MRDDDVKDPLRDPSEGASADDSRGPEDRGSPGDDPSAGHGSTRGSSAGDPSAGDPVFGGDTSAGGSTVDAGGSSTGDPSAGDSSAGDSVSAGENASTGGGAAGGGGGAAFDAGAPEGDPGGGAVATIDDPTAAGGSDDQPSQGDEAMSDTTTATGDRIHVPGSIAQAFPMLFIDMRERDRAERARLANELSLLEARKQEEGAAFPAELQARINQIRLLLEGNHGEPPPARVVDPFFIAIRQGLANSGVEVPDLPTGGIFPSQQNGSTTAQLTNVAEANLTAPERALSAVFGILSLDNNDRPETGFRFTQALSVALGEYAASRSLFDRVLAVVAGEGQQQLTLGPPLPGWIDGTRTPAPQSFRVVNGEQWVEVVRSLRNDGVTADDVQLSAKARSRFQQVVGADDDAAPSVIDIDLPDLEAQADVEILADNVRALQAVHFAAMLEELRLFQVVDKLVELFNAGLLPFGRGRAGDLLFAYWKKGVDRLTEMERRNIYARAFGMPGGDPNTPNPNREFGDLFLRFCSAVSEFVRQFTVEDLLRSSVPFRVSEEHIRKSGRDLAANLSLHGYGIAHYAATELQTQINDTIDILSDPEVRNAYGARDMFQVIDQVAALELGGARNGIRYRTMATSGAIIIRWLAERAGILASGVGTPLLDMAVVRRPPPRTPGTKPTTRPTDRDLVDAVEQWLAITGTPDDRVEEYSQPVESPNQTSRPIAIPQVARDLLEQVGVSAGYGNGGGGGGGGGGGARFGYR